MTPELTVKFVEAIEQVNKNLLTAHTELSGHIKALYGHIDKLAEIVGEQQKLIENLQRKIR